MIVSGAPEERDMTMRKPWWNVWMFTCWMRWHVPGKDTGRERRSHENWNAYMKGSCIARVWLVWRSLHMPTQLDKQEKLHSREPSFFARANGRDQLFWCAVNVSEDIKDGELLKTVTDERLFATVGKDRIVGIVSDRGPSFAKGKELLSAEQPHIITYACAAHMFHGVTEAVAATQLKLNTVDSCLQLCEDIVAFFKMVSTTRSPAESTRRRKGEILLKHFPPQQDGQDRVGVLPICAYPQW